MSKKIILALLFAIIILGAFLRLYQITEIPLGLYPDEAMNGNNALEALDTGKFKFFYPENNGREGFFINLQAISVWIFGNEPWALRLVSAILGTLTILGVYLVTKELFFSRKTASLISLLSAFFLATSFWHINFSRIGFRAIMVPLLVSFGIYFLLKGLHKGTMLDMVWAGIFIGLGFHTYLAFRFVPFILLIPLAAYLWRWKKGKTGGSCIPCLVALFSLVVLVVVLPLLIYFLQHSEDFFGRTGQVSIFSAESPAKEFLKSNAATLSMFFYRGDCNWRHNYACQPELYWLVAIFFAIGLLASIVKYRTDKFSYALLFGWALFMSFPATLTREGLPHALRSIGMIPPVMIFAGLGAWHTGAFIFGWFEGQKARWPGYISQLNRIERELAILFVLVLLLVPLYAFKAYFIRWAHHPETFFGFSTDLFHLGQFVNGQPDNIKKYVIVNRSGVEVRGIPMPAQTVMFVSDTYLEKRQSEKNVQYIVPSQISEIDFEEGERAMIALMEGKDLVLIRELRKRFPGFRMHAPSDFVVLEN